MKKTILGITILIGTLLFIGLIESSPGANTYSMDFELASSSVAYCSDSSDLSIAGDMTIMAWIKPESAVPTNTYYWIVGKWTPSNVSYYFTLRDGGGTKYITFRMSDDGNSHTRLDLAYDFGIGTWYHVAAAYDASAGTVQFFVDGATIGGVSGGRTAIYDGNAKTNIGGGFDYDNYYFDGLIDDVRIYNATRTTAAIAADYDTQLNGNEADLVAYWMLNANAEDKGEITDPAGSAADDLTFSGDPSFTTDVPFAGTAAAAPEEVVEDIIIFD